MKIWLPVVAALALSSSALAEDPTKKTFTTDGVSNLSIETAAGDITIKAGPGRFEVTVNHYDAERCVLTMLSKDGTLHLKAESKPGRGVFDKGCEAGFSVTAPAATRVTADAGAGTIDFDGVVGEVHAATGAGSIRGTLESRLAELSTGAGSIGVTWNKTPKDGRIKADTGAGSVRLAFPAGTKLESDLETGIGSVLNELGETKGAALKVKASSGVGSVSIAKS